MQGNESRLTCGERKGFGEVVGVPGSELSLGLEGSFVWHGADEVEGEVADARHVLGAVTGSEAGLVFVEEDVEDPVQAVLDGPVAAGGLGEVLGGKGAEET